MFLLFSAQEIRKTKETIGINNLCMLIVSPTKSAQLENTARSGKIGLGGRSFR